MTENIEKGYFGTEKIIIDLGYIFGVGK